MNSVYRTKITACIIGAMLAAYTLLGSVFGQHTLIDDAKLGRQYFYYCSQGKAVLTVPVVDAGLIASYEWQVSTDDGANWLPITAAGSSPTYAGYTTATLTITYLRDTHVKYMYRCKVTGTNAVEETTDDIYLLCSEVSRFGGSGGVNNVGEQALYNSFISMLTIPHIASQTESRYYYCDQGYADLSVVVDNDDNSFTYVWQFSTDGGYIWKDVYADLDYPRYKNFSTPNLNIDHLTGAHVGYKFRCAISNCAGITTYSEPIYLYCSNTTRYAGDSQRYGVWGNDTSTYFDGTVAPPSIIDQTRNCYYNCDQGRVEMEITPSEEDPSNRYIWEVSYDGGTSWIGIYAVMTWPDYTGFSSRHLLIENLRAKDVNNLYRCRIVTCSGDDVVSDPITLMCSQVSRFSGTSQRYGVFEEYYNEDDFVNSDVAPNIIDQTTIRYFNCADANMATELVISVTPEVDDPNYNYIWQVADLGQTNWVDIHGNLTNPNYSGYNTKAMTVMNLKSSNMNKQYRCIIRTCSEAMADTSESIFFTCSNTLRFSGSVGPDQTFTVKTENDDAGFKWVDMAPEYQNLNSACNEGNKTHLYAKAVTSTENDSLQYVWEIYLEDEEKWVDADSVTDANGMTFNYSHYRDTLTVDWNASTLNPKAYAGNYKYRCTVRDTLIVCQDPRTNTLTTHEMVINYVQNVASVTADTSECPQIDGYILTLHAFPYFLGTEYSTDGVTWTTDSVFNGGFSKTNTFYVRSTRECEPLEVSFITPVAPTNLFTTAGSSAVGRCIIDGTESGWKHILTADKQHIIASFKPNGFNFGEVSMTVFVDAANTNYVNANYTDDSGEWLMNRHFRFTYGNSTAVTADDDVHFRLYFTNDEYKAFMENTDRIEHFAEIQVYRYTDDLHLNVINNTMNDNDRDMGQYVNEATPLRVERFSEGVIFPNELDSIHYIEFILSGGRYSEFWLTDKPALTYTVTYEKNGESVRGQVPVDDSKYPIYSKVVVRGNVGNPKLTQPRAVFIGWSTRKLDFIVNSDYLDNIIRTNDYYGFHDVGSEFRITKRTTFYAVWAIDEDENGNPDYNDIPDPSYRVYYNGNNQTTGTAPIDNNIYNNNNSTLTLQSPGNLTKTNAVFIGWSLTQILPVINTQDDEDTWMPVIAVPGDHITVDDTLTYYAVWAVDLNGDGNPDYKETAHAVAYEGNGNTAGTAPTDNNTYLDGVDVPTLYNSEVPPLSKTNAVFLGWSFTKYAEDIASSNAENIASIIRVGNTFVMGDHDTTLFAVWGIDNNANGVADYKEPILAVNYHSNAAADAVIYTDKNAALNKYIEGDVVNVVSMAGVGVALTYANHVFLGWTKIQYAEISTVTAYNTIAAQILNVPSTVTIGDSDVELYALWAVDADGNDIPDFQESDLHITYHANGATGSAPTDANGYVKGSDATLKGQGDMTKLHATLVGWSVQQYTSVVAVQAVEDLLNVHVPGSAFTLTEDITLYAVWAEDNNLNGIPDYKEPKYTVTYNLNNATTGTLPVDATQYLSGEDATVLGSANISKDGAVFIGWSETRLTDFVTTTSVENLVKPLYQPGEVVGITDHNVTLYATWGVDANGNGTPDYREVTLTVQFRAGSNGRIVGTAYQSGIVYGSPWTSILVPTPSPNTGYVFAYWQDDLGNQVSSFPATVTTDMRFTAIFRLANSYFVAYNGNGQTSGNAPDTVKNISGGNTHIVLGNVGTNGVDTLIKTDAIFLGWAEKQYNVAISTQMEENIVRMSTNMHNAGSNIVVTDNVTLYALWAADLDHNGIPDYRENVTHTISFTAGSHGSLTGTDSYTNVPHNVYLSDYPFPTPVPDAGYQFAYWEDGSGNRIFNFPTLVSEDLSYTAVFESAAAAGTSTVTYLGNNNTSGTAPVDANSPYAANASVTVLGNTDLARTNCIFIGWSLRQYPDALTDKTAAAAITYSMGFYTAGNTFNITNDVVLYAVWAADANNNGIADYMEPYTVTYNGNYNTGGSVPVDANTYVEGSTATVADNTGSLVRTGAVWIGWTSSRTLGLVNSTSWANSLFLYNAGDDYTVNANTTMYAVWAIDENGNGTPDYQETYSVTFTAGANGSLSGTTNYTGIAYNTAWAESITTPTPTPAAGYKFDHWEDLDGTVVPNFPAVIKKDTAFRAIFVAITSNLHAYYYSNGATGSAPVDETNYAGGSSLTVKGNIGPDSLTKSNSVFLGWSLVRQNTINTQAEENALTLYKGGDAFVITQDTAFYAVWAKDVNGPNGVSDGIPDYKQKKVLYNNNGGKGEVIDNNIYDCGTENIPLMTQGSMYRGEALFLGWSTCDNGGDVIATEEDLEIFKASCTLLDPETDVTSIDELLCNNRTLYAIWGDVNEFPIELFAYRSDCMEEGGVLLTWTTATETNNEYFTLLRSEDGETFTEIGRTAGAGTANTFLTYTFVDESAIGGVLYYYKLQQTDFDGKMEELQIITALCETTEAADFNLYPNPTRDQLHLELTTTASGKLQAYIYSATGLLMRQYEWEDNAGRQSHSITVSDLAPGTYYLSLKGHVNNLQPAYKIVVVR